MTAPESFDVGVAHQIGHYADAVRVPAGYDQILVSGTPGLAPDGTVPGDSPTRRPWPDSTLPRSCPTLERAWETSSACGSG